MAINTIFQLLIVVALGVMASSVLTSALIPVLKNKQFQQFIREDGPKAHLEKSGTPTMGGIAIITSLVLVTVVGREYSMDTLIMIGVTIAFGLIGFLDDYIKISKKHNLGLRAWQKLVLQIIAAVGVALYMQYSYGEGTSVFIPFYGKYVDFGWLFIPFVVFVVVAMSNGVNLTDGLDGLSSGVTAIVSITFALTSIYVGNKSAMVFFSALAGACLGFLIFNKYPAKLFMGDTGSLALGGALAAGAILLKMEFLLPIAGIIYVLEALSVIIQVGYYKRTKKRIFRMAPLHHHFEVGGMKETKVVLMFWGITLIGSLIGLFSIR